MKGYWMTQNGDEIKYKQLKDSHLLNILKWINRRADEGMIIEYGGGGIDIEDLWYDSEEIKGQKVLEYYDYEDLLKEAKKRLLIH
jgi:hypothetical protein